MVPFTCDVVSSFFLFLTVSSFYRRAGDRGPSRGEAAFVVRYNSFPGLYLLQGETGHSVCFWTQGVYERDVILLLIKGS